MTSSIDPIVMRLAHEWVAQYSRFRRLDSTLVGDLLARSEEFESVPVPRRLLQALASPEAVGAGVADELFQLMEVTQAEAVGPQTLGLFGERRRTGVQNWATALFRRLVASIENRDVAACREVFAESYLDARGCDREAVVERLRKLFDADARCRLLPVSVSTVVLANGQVDVESEIIWDRGTEAALNGERLLCTMRVECHDDAWLITHLDIA